MPAFPHQLAPAASEATSYPPAPVTRRAVLATLAGAAVLPAVLPALAHPVAGLALPGPAAAPGPPVVPGDGRVQSQQEHSIQVISVSRLQAAARQLLPAGSYAYIHGGKGDEWTMAQNERQLRRLAFRPHRLAGFSQAAIGTSLLGHSLPLPLYVCPMGAQDFANRAADLASARAAAAVGAVYILSSASNKPLEEVARASGAGVRWFAIYLNTDPAVNRSLAQRARAAGYSALVLTVDSLGPGQSDAYLALGTPKSPTGGAGNFDPRFGGIGEAKNLKKDFSPADIGGLHEASGGLPVLVKGILRPEDATRCVEAGAAGIIVSNHGGRTLDGAPASITVLASIVKAVNGRVPVLFDSGVRRGTDIVRALALGAAAVGIGRPVLYGMALGGAAGATDVLRFFRQELLDALLLVGAPRIQDLSPDFLEPQNPDAWRGGPAPG